MQDISGFAPGLDPTTPGVITDCYNMLPSTNGMIAAGSGADVGANAVIGDVLRLATLLKLSASARTFAGTDTKIYELSGGSWNDVSVSGGYSSATDWQFAQFGDVSLATDYVDPVQYSISGAFADLAGAPKAKLIEVASGFVMLFDYNDGVDSFADGWWCSGLYDYTAWTPSPSTQAANGRLFDTPGGIKAAKRIGSGIAVYKNNAIYLGNYVGPPIIWSWTQITAETGAYCQGAVVNVSGVHFFLGQQGIFMFDGSRPVPVGAQEVREWLRQNINPNYTDKITSIFDSKRSMVFWFFPSVLSTGVCDMAIVFNTVTNMFGLMHRDIIDLTDYKAPDLTWGDVGSLGVTWADVGAKLTTWDDAKLFGNSVGISYLSTDGKIYRIESNAGQSSITTGDMGDDLYLSTIKRVKPRFINSPDSAQLTHYHKRNEGESLTEGVTVSMNDGKFDLLKSDRWHRLKLSFVGNCEITAIDTTLKVNGTR